jgi:ElaB/YqjD/DUF883 family membrane-anchored ribosome-binding protein
MPNAREAEHDDLEPESSPLDEVPNELLDRLENVGQKVTEFVVERPLTSVAVAVAIGFLFGRMMRR